MTGTIKRVYLARGFGFLRVDGEGQGDLFFHRNDMLPALSFGDPLVGMRVEFEIGESRRGAVRQECS